MNQIIFDEFEIILKFYLNFQESNIQYFHLNFMSARKIFINLQLAVKYSLIPFIIFILQYLQLFNCRIANNFLYFFSKLIICYYLLILDFDFL